MKKSLQLILIGIIIILSVVVISQRSELVKVNKFSTLSISEDLQKFYSSIQGMCIAVQVGDNSKYSEEITNAKKYSSFMQNLIKTDVKFEDVFYNIRSYLIFLPTDLKDLSENDKKTVINLGRKSNLISEYNGNNILKELKDKNSSIYKNFKELKQDL